MYFILSGLCIEKSKASVMYSRPVPLYIRFTGFSSKSRKTTKYIEIFYFRKILL